MLKLKRLIIPSAGKDEEKLEGSQNIGGDVKWGSHFGKQLAVSYKVKHMLVIPPTNPSPKYLPREIKAYVYTKFNTWIPTHTY